MLIHNPQDQIEQVHKNTYFLLSRLGSTTGYIDTETTQKILKITRQGATKYLNRATSWGFLKKHTVQMMNLRKRSIYGLTLTGVEYIVENHDKYINDYGEINLDQLNPWSIHRFRGSAHRHEMLLIIISRMYGIKNNKIHPQYYAYKKRKADFGVSNNKVEVAIEVELTIKSQKRYKNILWAYRKHFHNHDNTGVFWIVESNAHAKRLSKILDEFEDIDEYKKRHHIKVYCEKRNKLFDNEMPEYISEEEERFQKELEEAMKDLY